MTRPKLTSIPVLATGLVLWLAPIVFADNEATGHNWPQFRGFRAQGLARGPATPVRWDVDKGTNLAWQTPIPGLAHSAPIVWGDRVYVTTAVTEGAADLKTGLYGNIGSAKDVGVQQWRLLAIHKKTGKILFDKLAHEAKPRVKRHPKATHCNSTPATNGKRIVAIFGSEGLFCFDLDGDLQWKRDLGPMDSGYFRVKSAQWGFASSPVTHRDKVVVLCDVQDNSSLALFDLADGRELWRTPRDDVPTWSTPTIAEVEGRTQILVNGYRHTGAYDFETGQEIWKLEGGGDIPVPTPVTSQGLAFFTSAHGRSRPMRAVRLGAKGDITPPKIDQTNDHIVWVHQRSGNYMSTPIVVGDSLYACHDTGVLTCFDARSGAIRYQERLPEGGGFTASPVSDGRHLYFPGETGTVFVLKAGPTFSLQAANELGESCLATPAISEGLLYFRTRHRLIAIKN